MFLPSAFIFRLAFFFFEPVALSHLFPTFRKYTSPTAFFFFTYRLYFLFVCFFFFFIFIALRIVFTATSYTMTATDYDVIVVGAGMFGSSAAKHLRRLQPSLRVAVIGPDNNSGRLARGQHFDEARICRRVETAVPWAHLNDLGALSYRETEATSGVSFYTPCGCMWVGTAEDRDASMECMDSVQRASGGADAVTYAVVCEEGDAGAAAAAAATAAGKTSVLRVTASSSVAEGVFGGEIRVGQLADAADGVETYYIAESGAAGGGTVHPTQYVKAQLACAAAVSPASNFCHLLEVVLQIACVAAGEGGDDCVYAVKTDAEHTYTAGRVLVATASFTKYHKLLPESVTDRLKPLAADVVLLRLVPPHGDDHEANVKASELCPSMIKTTGKNDDERIYTLPPRYYAEHAGWYVKMGRAGGPAAAVRDVERHTLAAAMAWYDTGKEVPKTDPCVTHLANMLQDIFPRWPVAPDTPEQSNRETVRCIVDETKEDVPMLDCVDGKGLFCAIAGNGRGAKTCDPIGCIAAHRVLGKELPPAYSFAKDAFRL
uniref:Sarcosine oxidase n=1 Tax=Crithidia mellificae TaxID=796356 RepID=V9LTT2_CRIME|nr:sarcosine oxidase [Crithidia mellificae]